MILKNIFNNLTKFDTMNGVFIYIKVLLINLRCYVIPLAFGGLHQTTKK